MLTYDFDPTSVASIKAQAEKVLYKSLRQVLSPAQLAEVESKLDRNRKGHFGDIVEKYIFNKEPDSKPIPDFPKAHLELKTTPIKASKTKGFVAKERLVLGMIDFFQVHRDQWETSDFLKKNAHLLILFYLYAEHTDLVDYKFKLIKLLDLLTGLSATDVSQIKNDWEAIAAKVRAGKAHELSEGDTFYLGACTKGATAEESYRTQPFSVLKAKSRAFSLKPKYLNFIISENAALIAADHDEIIPKGAELTIENVVKNKLTPYLGLTAAEIHKRTGAPTSARSKSYYADLARAMLGARKKKIAEFEKANITMKTIRLKRSGTPKESMSFPAIDYMAIVKEEWDDSIFKEQISSDKFLFLVYKYDAKGELHFEKYMFWNMPYQDLEGHARRVWEATQDRIRSGHADVLPRIKDDPVCHVRPHGRDSNDKAMTPYGVLVKKQSFWLNASYIRDQINKAGN